MEAMVAVWVNGAPDGGRRLWAQVAAFGRRDDVGWPKRGPSEGGMAGEGIGVGLVGYGLAGSVLHAPLIQMEDRLRLRAVASRRPDRVHRDFPELPVVATPAELLQDPAVELVVVAAPNAVHYRLAGEASAPAGTWSSTSRLCPGHRKRRS